MKYRAYMRCAMVAGLYMSVQSTLATDELRGEPAAHLCLYNVRVQLQCLRRDDRFVRNTENRHNVELVAIGNEVEVSGDYGEATDMAIHEEEADIEMFSGLDSYCLRVPLNQGVFAFNLNGTGNGGVLE